MWKNSLQKISIKVISDYEYVSYKQVQVTNLCVRNGPWKAVSQEYITFFHSLQ